MGTSHRIAAVAAVAHAKNFYNHTQPAVVQNTDATHYTVNIFFISATLCGVLVAVCAACWRRKPRSNKPENVAHCGVYTVASDARLGQQLHLEEVTAEPPPAYETVVVGSPVDKDSSILQDVLTEPCPKCTNTTKADSGLPSYEAAVFLRDTKL